MRLSPLLVLTVFIAGCTSQPGDYHLTKTIPVPGDGGWDLLTADKASRQLYIAHDTQVDVMDMDSGELKGKITGIKGAHDTAIAWDYGRGYITNGKSNSVTVFDTKILNAISHVKTDKKPDAIVYDAATHHVFAFNGSGSATVINAKTGKVVGIVALGGEPEFAVADEHGHIYVNLENKNKVLKIDTKKRKVVKRWSLAPGKQPASLALDRQNDRLFVGCRNKLLVVVNADSGKVITTLPIGEHVDSTAYDPGTKKVISSNGDGTITIITQDSPDNYHVSQTVTTQKGSKTMALDETTHKLFVPAAQFNPAPAPTADNPKPRPTVIPGTFNVLVFEQ